MIEHVMALPTEKSNKIIQDVIDCIKIKNL